MITIRDLLSDPDPFGVNDPTPAELREEALQREDERDADADWGWEPPC